MQYQQINKLRRRIPEIQIHTCYTHSLVVYVYNPRCAQHKWTLVINPEIWGILFSSWLFCYITQQNFMSLVNSSCEFETCTHGALVGSFRFGYESATAWHIMYAKDFPQAMASRLPSGYRNHRRDTHAHKIIVTTTNSRSHQKPHSGSRSQYQPFPWWST